MSGRKVQITERGGTARLTAVGPHRLVADERAPVGEGTGPAPIQTRLEGHPGSPLCRR